MFGLRLCLIGGCSNDVSAVRKYDSAARVRHRDAGAGCSDKSQRLRSGGLITDRPDLRGQRDDHVSRSGQADRAGDCAPRLR